jgi:hypothetical protein
VRHGAESETRRDYDGNIYADICAVVKLYTNMIIIVLVTYIYISHSDHLFNQFRVRVRVRVRDL